jgi:hypothetical protein
MNFMRSEMSKKQRMASSNEVYVTVLRGGFSSRVTHVRKHSVIIMPYTHKRMDVIFVDYFSSPVCKVLLMW